MDEGYRLLLKLRSYYVIYIVKEDAYVSDGFIFSVLFTDSLSRELTAILTAGTSTSTI